MFSTQELNTLLRRLVAGAVALLLLLLVGISVLGSLDSKMVALIRRRSVTAVDAAISFSR